MVNYRPIAIALAMLTVISAGAAGYFATNPSTTITTVTATQLGTVTNVVTSTNTVSSASATAPPTVKLAYKQGVGFYMTNSSGWTLYLFKRDNQSVGTSACTGGCIANWPAFYASNLILPAGFDQNDFKLVPRADGVKQLAYYGWPLYFYSKDKAPGDTVGQAVGNVWFVCCNPAAATTTTTSTTATTTSTTTTTSKPAAAVQVSILSGASVQGSVMYPTPGYAPETVTLVRGVNATVAWTNKDTSTHTVTSISFPAGAQSFASGDLKGGATFTLTFTVPGTYAYHCDYHSWMMATIIVK